MNCDWVQENIPLYLYDELADDARHELEGHVERCAECAAELKALRVFHGELTGVPQLEVTPNLLASARMQLAEALETVEQRRGWRWVLDPMALLRQMRFSPALATIIFIVGFGGGIGTMYHMSASLHGGALSPGISRKLRLRAFEILSRNRAATGFALTTNERCRRRYRVR